MNEQNAENQATITPAVAPVIATVVTPATTSQKSVKKIADRPHWITILLGLVSPILAGVALIISLESLRTSERTLEIGQRAYVALQNEKITFGQIIVRTPTPSWEVRPPDEQLATLLISITLANSGNTPAEFTRFVPTFKQLPEGWALKKQDWQPMEKTPPILGAKSQSVWEYRESFLLTPKAWSLYSEPGIAQALYFSGELQYLDVFKKEHAVNWCWMLTPNENNLYPGAVECGKMTFERTK